MGSIIRAYNNSSVPEFEPLSLDACTDDVYDEVETSPGVILKFPSAVSIEARGFLKQGSSVHSHSRQPSLVRQRTHYNIEIYQNLFQRAASERPQFG